MLFHQHELQIWDELSLKYYVHVQLQFGNLHLNFFELFTRLHPGKFFIVIQLETLVSKIHYLNTMEILFRPLKHFQSQKIRIPQSFFCPNAYWLDL